MNERRKRSRPVQMLVALLYGASAAHAAFIVGLLWLRPGMDMSAIAVLLFLPFFYVLLAFVPIVLFLTLIRLVLGRFTTSFARHSIISTFLLSILGLGAAVGVLYLTLGWMPSGTDIFDSVLLGAAIGGIVTGYMVSRKGMLGEDVPE